MADQPVEVEVVTAEGEEQQPAEGEEQQPAEGEEQQPAEQKTEEQPKEVTLQDQVASSSAKPRRASLGQRIAAGLSRAKQVVLQSLGEIQLPPEDPNFSELLGGFHLDCVALNEMHRRTKALYEQQQQVITDQTTFAEALAKLGSHSKSGGDIVQEFVPYTLRLQTHQKDFLNDLKAMLVDPLTAVLLGEVAVAKELQQKYDVARLELGDRNRTLKSKNTEANRQRVADAEQEVTKVRSSLADTIALVQSKKNALLQTSLQDYINQQHKFYEESTKVVEDKRSQSFALTQNEDEDLTA